MRLRSKLLIAMGASLLCVLGVAAATLSLSWRYLNTPISVADGGYIFEVPPGASMITVARNLNSAGLLDRAYVLSWYARFSGDATRIHAGEYRLDQGTTPLELLNQLVSGTVLLHRFTIVEGWTVREMLPALQNHPAIVATAIDFEKLMEAFGEPQLHPEGQFFPDTYSFPRGTTDIELLGTAHAALQAALARIWPTRSIDSVLESPYEALILASIIEKETALATERRLISGVMHRRLQRGIRLQTDPTVIYGLGEEFDGNIRRADLTRDTPYNTYTRNGLPPTPIALVGGAALQAAVDPAPGDALYFVATGLPDGSHQFSATLEEHNRAVQEYNRRLREGSEP